MYNYIIALKYETDNRTSVTFLLLVICLLLLKIITAGELSMYAEIFF